MKRATKAGSTRTVLYAALWTVVVVIFLTLRLIHQGFVLTSPPGNILIIDSQYYYNWAEQISGVLVFELEDLRDPSGLATKVQDPTKPVSVYIHEQLSPQTRQMLEVHGGSSRATPMLHKALVDEMNRLLSDDALYNPERFAEVEMPAALRLLAESDPSGRDLRRANRGLLETAYPYIFRSNRFVRLPNGLGNSVFFMSPLYPVFIALALKLNAWLALWFQVYPSGITTTMLLQLVLSLATLGLIGRYTTRRFGPAAGVIAGLLYALFGPSIYYDSILLSATLILFLTMAALTFLDLFLDNGKRWPIVLAGLAIGLSTLARPSALILLVVFGFVLIRKWKSYGVEQTSILVLSTVLVIFPALLRNYLHGGEWYITTNSAGVNFYIGNNPNAIGLYDEMDWLSSAEPTYEAADYRQEAQRRLGKALTLSEASNYWLKQGLGWVAKHPVDWLVLEAKKLAYFLNRVETPNNVSYYGVQEYSPILRALGFFNFGILAPLGLVGLFLARREQGWDFAVALLVGVLLVALLFFVAGEYRYPVIGILFAYGAGALTRTYVKLKNREFERAQWAMIGVLALLMICNIPWPLMKKVRSPRMDYFNWASVSFAQGDLANASLLFTAAIAYDPTWAEAHVQLAQVFDAWNLTDLADQEYAAAGITREQLIEAREKAELTTVLPDSLAVNGDFSEVSPEQLTVVGARFNQLGKYRQAVLVLQEAVMQDSTNFDARFHLAFAYEAVGARKSAVDLYFELENERPLDPLIPFRIAWCYFGMNNYGQSTATLNRVKKKADELADKESRERWYEIIERTRNTFMNY